MKNEATLNLYIIAEVLTDWTSGMAVIAAPNKERCREIFLKEFGEYYMKDYDENAEFTVIEGVNHSEGVVQYVYGGG